MPDIETMNARDIYFSYFDCIVDSIEFEERAIGIGRELLPPCALVVLDGDDPTADYWNWLAEQIAAVIEES